MPTVEQKVDSLKKAIEDFVKYTGIEFNKVYNLQMQNEIDIKNLSEEMKVFKDEMSDFKKEMRAQNKEMNIRWLEDKIATLERIGSRGNLGYNNTHAYDTILDFSTPLASPKMIDMVKGWDQFRRR